MAQKKVTTQFVAAVAPINAATQALRQFAGVADLSLRSGASVRALQSIGAAVTALGGDINDAGKTFGQLDAWMHDIRMGGSGGNLNEIAKRYGLRFDQIDFKKPDAMEKAFERINKRMNQLSETGQRGLARQLGLSDAMFRLLKKTPAEYQAIQKEKDKFNAYPLSIFSGNEQQKSAQQKAAFEALTERSLRYRTAVQGLSQAFAKWQILLADLMTKLTPFIEQLAAFIANLADSRAAIYTVAALLGGVMLKSVGAIITGFKAFLGIKSLAALGINTLGQVIFNPIIAFKSFIKTLAMAKLSLASFAAQMASVKSLGLTGQIKALVQTVTVASSEWISFAKVVIGNVWGIIGSLLKLALATITNPFFLILAGLVAIIAAFKYCGKAVGMLTVAVVALGVAWYASGIGAVVTMVVAIIAAIIGVGYAIYHWQETVEELGKAWKKFIAWLSPIWEKIKGAISAVGEWFSELGGKIWDVLTNVASVVWDVIKEIGSIIWDSLKGWCGWFGAITGFILSPFVELGKFILNKLGFNVDKFLDGVKRKWNKFKSWLGFGDDEENENGAKEGEKKPPYTPEQYELAKNDHEFFDAIHEARQDRNDELVKQLQAARRAHIHEDLMDAGRKLDAAGTNYLRTEQAAAGFSQMQMITRTNQSISDNRSSQSVKVDGGIHIHTTASTIEGIGEVTEEKFTDVFTQAMIMGSRSTPH